jgi:cob(I)alamin adenosyltransferase
VPLFQAQGVERELLAALMVWVEAAREECATADVARDLLRRLERRRPLEAVEEVEGS